MKIYFLILITALWVKPIVSLATHIEVSGSVSGTWTVDTVIVTDNIKVPFGEQLVINPGILVEFQDHYQFCIDGSLVAIGNEVDSIRFTINDTAGFSHPANPEGAWNGLWFFHLAPVNDSSLFEYCHFEYSKATGADSLLCYGGAVCIREYNKVRFSHCCFAQNKAFKNGGGIYAKNSALVIENCHFRSNSCGNDSLYGYGGGLCLEYANAVVIGNCFNNNSSTGVGGGLSFEFSNPRIESNVFENNYSAIGGGFVGLRSSGARSMVNNLVCNNSSLFFGGGIAMIETTTLFTNNTIADNNSGAGGGLYFNTASSSEFKNCIIFNNYDLGGGGPQVYIWDTFSAPEFYYCCVEGGEESFGGTGGQPGGFIGVYENCIESDPGFLLNSVLPYDIPEISACFDAGTPDTTGLLLPLVDLAGRIRLSGNNIDMGAYETETMINIPDLCGSEFEFTIYPNPTDGRLNVSLKTCKHERVILSLHDPLGHYRNILFNKVLPAADHCFHFNIDIPNTSLAGNIYFIELQIGEERWVKQVVVGEFR